LNVVWVDTINDEQWSKETDDDDDVSGFGQK
jgi:hypothetical protein